MSLVSAEEGFISLGTVNILVWGQIILYCGGLACALQAV